MTRSTCQAAGDNTFEKKVNSKCWINNMDFGNIHSHCDTDAKCVYN